MVSRLTVDEFFVAMREQGVYPLVDTPTARKVVLASARTYGAEYPVKDRWPVLDLESSYEGHLNGHANIVEFHRNGYSGTINLRGFDDNYTMDEWFNDFRNQWSLIDNHRTRQAMLAGLPPTGRWLSSTLYEAYDAAVRTTVTGVVRRLFKSR